MAKYPYLLVDAFTDEALSGNPCAVLLDTGQMSDERRLAVAREMNLSETAFVVGSAQADFGARYFTPAEEIPMAGHPTLAVTRALIDCGRLRLIRDRQEVSLELKAGVIRVEIVSRQGQVEKIVMTQNKPQFLSSFDAGEVMPIFGLAPKDLLAGAPIQTVSTGTPQLMVPLASLDGLKRACLDLPAYRAFRRRADFFSPHLFCLQGVSAEGRTFARHFGAPPDTPEDPFTGSATGGMGAYLWRHGLIESPRFVAEQGHWMRRPGRAEVEVVGPREHIETVKVGGQAVVVAQGEISF